MQKEEQEAKERETLGYRSGFQPKNRAEMTPCRPWYIHVPTGLDRTKNRKKLEALLVIAFRAPGVGYSNYIQRKKTSPVPSGPRGLPFAGNVLDVLWISLWIKFAELGNAGAMSTRYIIFPGLPFEYNGPS
ncbi:hypothetical protein B0H13DRAFT_1864633 [Mycena leptocephala]|nr:hypothetical protein B0H13DRAFT_1864633 [Mycena leptocephala]